MNGNENGQITDIRETPVAEDAFGVTAEEKTFSDDGFDMTKRMSERINEIRKKEVEPLAKELSALKELSERTRDFYEKDSQEFEYLRKKDFERTKADVLDSLKKEFPDDNIKDIDHFDKRFYAMLKVGVDAPSAYRAVVGAARAKAMPTSGSIQGADIPSGYYSEETVRAMSANEIKLNYDKVIASMKKWQR